MLYREVQENAPPLFEAIGCIVSAKRKILLLKRCVDKPYPSRWGIPSGKIDGHESRIIAAIRELYEETGILVSAEQLSFVGTYHIVTTDMSFLYSLFTCRFVEFPEIRLNPKEHDRINWFTPQDCSRLPLMPDLEGCIQEALGVLQSSPTQINLFTGLVESNKPMACEIEAAVRTAVTDEVQADIRSTERPWIASLGAPCTGKSKIFHVIARTYGGMEVVMSRGLVKKTSTLNHCLRRVFEEDDKSNALRLQLEILLSRFRQSFVCPANSLVVETVYGTLAHSRAMYDVNMLSDDEYQSFYSYYLLLVQFLPIPAKICYFYSNPLNILTNIRERAGKVKSRGYEMFYTQQYIFALSHAFSQVASELSKEIEVLYFDVNRLSPKEIANMVHIPWKSMKGKQTFIKN